MKLNELGKNGSSQTNLANNSFSVANLSIHLSLAFIPPNTFFPCKVARTTLSIKNQDRIVDK